MKNLTNYGSVSVQTGSNVVAFETIYIVACQDVLGQVQERQFDDVSEMLGQVKIWQSLPDSVDVTVTRYRQTGLELSRPAQVCRHVRGIVPAYLNAGDCGLENGLRLAGWRTVQAWPIRSAGIIGPVSFMDEREQILTNKKARVSEFVGNKYRETIPQFTMDSIDDLSILDTIQGVKNMSFEYVDSDGETVEVQWNALNTNFWRKHADRFDSDGFDGANIRTIAESIFAEAWLESRQAFPDQWIAITYRERYIGKIRSARWIQARINAGLSFNNSEEWKGKERVRRDTNCETRDGFIVLLSSYAVARAIQEIVQPFKMEYSDMAELKASKVDAITLEHREILTMFEQEVCKLLMTDHTERQAAENLGVERTKIRQAKMRIKLKMAEFMPD